FVEPTSLLNAFPYPGDLVGSELTDPRDGPARIVYAGHMYEPSTHEGSGYSQDSTYLDEWFDLRDPEAAEMDASLWFGEWGGTPDQDGMDRYIDEVLERADEHMIGWSWWSWDPGGWSPIDGDLEEMTENGAALQRVQPQAISGTPEEFSWDQDESIFTMDWTGRSEVVEPTLIAVPEALFNDGIEV